MDKVSVCVVKMNISSAKIFANGYKIPGEVKIKTSEQAIIPARLFVELFIEPV